MAGQGLARAFSQVACRSQVLGSGFVPVSGGRRRLAACRPCLSPGTLEGLVGLGRRENGRAVGVVRQRSSALGPGGTAKALVKTLLCPTLRLYGTAMQGQLACAKVVHRARRGTRQVSFAARNSWCSQRQGRPLEKGACTGCREAGPFKQAFTIKGRLTTSRFDI